MSYRELRKALRVARRGLTSQERMDKSQLIAQQVVQSRMFQGAHRVAAYWVTPEEVDTTLIMQVAADQGKTVYLPVINADLHHPVPMYFAEYAPGVTKLVNNRFRIPEPAAGPEVQLPEIDLILVPLVGFNLNCDRIGMGGGYYDRVLAGANPGNRQFVGLAFDCQRVEFQPEAHDVPMHAIATESGIHHPATDE